MSTQNLPDLLGILTPLFDQCEPQEQRILLAVLERRAAEHYRAWGPDLGRSTTKIRLPRLC